MPSDAADCQHCGMTVVEWKARGGGSKLNAPMQPGSLARGAWAQHKTACKKAKNKAAEGAAE